MAIADDVTLVFTDVADSTRLVELLGDAAAADLWTQHDRSVRGLLQRHGGREIDRTDGFFALFWHAGDAAAFASEYHAAAAALRLRARVALHTGSVTLRENDPADVARGAKPAEVEGVAKPFAARLNALAAPGQTLASAAARSALGDGGGALRSHGHYRLKGIAEPVEIFELGHGAAPAFAPPGDTDKAYRVVRTGRDADAIWQPMRDVPHNLPAERDAFIGRAAELHALATRVDAGERLLTVLGPGGIGKTRFVRRYARLWLGDWPGGVHFCDLSDARSADGVLVAVAVGLGVPFGRGDALAQLGHAIAGRGTCLVILDNVEQVLEPVAAALTGWLDRAGHARFVITSRERLRLEGEGIFPLETLPLEGDTGTAEALFLARARAQRPGFAADAAQREAVAAIVRLLDGMPLAIELAAARVRLLSPAQIVERLRDRFALLAGGRGAGARQATLRGAIDWSWDLLSPAEQSAFAQCAVFEGGFTLAAAEAVLDLAGEGATALDVVQSLLDKSLLRASHPRDEEAGAEPRLGMYASLHEYARERLDASGHAVEAEARHGRFFAAPGLDTDSFDALWGRDGVARRRALAVDLDNLVVACRRALARGDGEVAAASYALAWSVLFRQGPRALGVALGAELTAARLPPGPRLLALSTYGAAAHAAGDPERGAVAALEALEQARMLQDVPAEAEALARLGEIRFDQMRVEESRVYLDAALVASRAAGARRTEVQVLAHLTTLAHHAGHWDEFETLASKALALLHETGYRSYEPALLNMRAMHEHARGQVQAAMELYRRAADIAHELGLPASEATALSNTGSLLIDLGRTDEALSALHAALAIHRAVGGRGHEGIVLGNIALVHQQQGRLEEARAELEATLAITREVGDRRHELYILGSIGELHLEQQRPDDADACYADALARARGPSYRFTAGRLLAGLARLRWRQNRLDEAEQALAEGEELLRSADELIELARLHCTRGRLALARARRDDALAALAAAEAQAASLGVGGDSLLARDIEALRQAIG